MNILEIRKLRIIFTSYSKNGIVEGIPSVKCPLHYFHFKKNVHELRRIAATFFCAVCKKNTDVKKLTQEKFWHFGSDVEQLFDIFDGFSMFQSISNYFLC